MVFDACPAAGLEDKTVVEWEEVVMGGKWHGTKFQKEAERSARARKKYLAKINPETRRTYESTYRENNRNSIRTNAWLHKFLSQCGLRNDEATDDLKESAKKLYIVRKAIRQLKEAKNG